MFNPSHVISRVRNYKTLGKGFWALGGFEILIVSIIYIHTLPKNSIANL